MPDNGIVERFNGPVQREVLGITLYSHPDLKTLLAAFNVAYNGRRQRVLKGRSPDMVLRERLRAKPELAKPVTKPPDPDALPKALKVVADVKEVSHLDSQGLRSAVAPATERRPAPNSDREPTVRVGSLSSPPRTEVRFSPRSRISPVALAESAPPAHAHGQQYELQRHGLRHGLP